MINDWTQLGNDIDGETSQDYSGQSVSLNSAGDIVAIGAIRNDGNGPDSGHVRVYRFPDLNDNGATWQQLGNDIDGETSQDQSGQSVSLNSAGDIVAIGAVRNDGNGPNSGHVRVYRFPDLNDSGATWQQLGNDIDGETMGDQSGQSVSLNSTGNILAIGANNDGNGINSGHVRVFTIQLPEEETTTPTSPTPTLTSPTTNQNLLRNAGIVFILSLIVILLLLYLII
jgi:hypothetical protein